MPNVMVIGEKINARLTNHYIGALTTAQANLARYIIRCLRRDCTEGCCAHGTFRGLTLRIRRGRITVGNNPERRLLPDAPTVGETVCAAVLAGVQFNGAPDRTPREERDEKPKSTNPALALLERLWQLREFVERGEGVSDVVSTRSIGNAAAMFYAGFPVDAILSAMTMTWPDTARAKVGVGAKIDAAKVKLNPIGQKPKVPYSRRHGIYDYVRALCDAKVGVMMIGPAGTGKGYLARQIADEKGLSFAAVPLTEGASISWLLGRHTPQGFVETDFLRAFRDGGVFLFDEIDAGDPNMLIVVNDALANGTLDNPLTGETIERHADFVPMAAANTYGTGADASYTGRNRLDGATLDRWRMGRVEMSYDRDLERAIMGVSD